MGDSQALSPRVFIDRATPGDERCRGKGTPGTPAPPPPGLGGGPGGGREGARPAAGCPAAQTGSLLVCLQLRAAPRQPSLVKCCHLLLLRVIPLYEFFWLLFVSNIAKSSGASGSSGVCTPSVGGHGGGGNERQRGAALTLSRHPNGAALSLWGWGQGEGSGIPPPPSYIWVSVVGCSQHPISPRFVPGVRVFRLGDRPCGICCGSE